MSVPGGRLVLSAIDPCINDSGNLSAGAQITFWDTGTTNLANIYSDQNLTTGVSNPQFTDQNGRAYSQTTQFFADINSAYDVNVQMPTGENITFNTIWPDGQAPSFGNFLSNPSVVLTGNPTATTPVTADNSSSLATTAFVRNYGATIQVFPPGLLAMFGSQTPPSGWLTCDGSAVSRTTYAGLFAAIGTQWGSGDGTSTFNLPNFLGQFPRGLDTGGSVDPGRSFASGQGFAQQDHVHPTYASTIRDSSSSHTDYSSHNAIAVINGSASYQTNSEGGGNSPLVGTITQSGVQLAAEVRPVNVAIIFIIRT